MRLLHHLRPVTRLPLRSCFASSSKQKRQVRQHVNPLASAYQQQIDIPEWKSIYPDQLPIHLDIGCARGKYLMKLAAANPMQNYLGLEIRKPLVVDAIHDQQRQELHNLHFMFANMNAHGQDLLASIKASPLSISSISIFHPDPHFKLRHRKRRLVTPELVEIMAKYLEVGTPVHIQSDVLDLYQDMAETIAASPGFELDETQDTSSNALGLATDRELYVRREGGDIYRCTFILRTTSLQ